MHESPVGPSRHISAPRDLGRERGIAEVDARPSNAEGGARDPDRTLQLLPMPLVYAGGVTGQQRVGVISVPPAFE